MWRRVRIYLLGVFLGTLFVYFFLIRGKDRNFSFWFPSNRIIEEIQTKKMNVTPRAFCMLTCMQTDTSNIKPLLKNATIDFSKSLPRNTPKTYYLSLQNMHIWVEVNKNNSTLLNVFPVSDTLKCDCNVK